MTVSPCPLCPRLHGHPECRPVLDCGPSPAALLFLGAGPGKTEAQTGTPYSGLAGDEFTQTYLAVAHLSRYEVHIANSTLCWAGDDKVPDKRVVACASQHLPEVLSRVRPEVVVLMGGVVQQLSDLRIRLDMQHGIPFWGSVLGGRWNGWIWPMYEPALGMRETSRMTQLIEDFTHLGQWLRGEWKPKTYERTDQGLQFDKPDYGLCRTADEVDDYWEEHGPAKSDRYYRLVAVDTETHGGRPWSVQWSAKPGTGRMVLAEDKRAIEGLGRWLRDKEVVLHNAGQDLDTLDRMGVEVGDYRDSMQEAFHLCSVPQGLKALAYRLLGVTMRSWEDVVRPASVQAVMRWVREAAKIAAEEFQVPEVKVYKRPRCARCEHSHKPGEACRTKLKSVNEATGELVVVYCGCEGSEFYTSKTDFKPGAIQSICAHVTRYVESTADADEPYDPWEALRKMKAVGLRGKTADSWEWEEVERRLGPIPILGIGNCELADAVEYGCSDADHTRQVAIVLDGLRADPKWEVAKEDWDR